MKYILIVPDGLTDLPVKKLKNKTPLELAKIPHINYMLQNGLTGVVSTIPKGMKPGSDVANLSIMGVNPANMQIGRGALEALAQDIKIQKDETVFRANFVVIENNILTDYNGCDIANKHAKYLINQLNRFFKNDGVRFYPGVGYRNIAVVKKTNLDISTCPPHDITNKNINKYLPKGKDRHMIINIMEKSNKILSSLDYVKKNKIKANYLWLWGQGHLLQAENFKDKYKLKGAVISAVDIIKGIAKLIKMDVIKVPGITGNFDTNYRNKYLYALKNLKKYDVIYIHIEAPDEAGHIGSAKEKIRAIQNIDQHIVKPLLALKNQNELKIILVPDHPTPITLQTHINQEVPFIIYAKNNSLYPNHKFKQYNEKILKNPPVFLKNGHQFLKNVILNKV